MAALSVLTFLTELHLRDVFSLRRKIVAFAVVHINAPTAASGHGGCGTVPRQPGLLRSDGRMPPDGAAGASGGADGQSLAAAVASTGASVDGPRRFQRFQRPQRSARTERIERTQRTQRIERRFVPADVAAAERRSVELVQTGA